MLSEFSDCELRQDPINKLTLSSRHKGANLKSDTKQLILVSVWAGQHVGAGVCLHR